MITALQKQQRMSGIGASELGAIMGLDPWRTAYDVWLEKTGKLEEEAEQSDAAELGEELEPTIARLAGKRLGFAFVKPTGTYKHENGVMFANLDGQREKSVRGAEVGEWKSSGIADGWGEAGSDQIPEKTLVQVHGQMLCSDGRVAHVGRLLGRFGLKFDLYRVEFNPRLGEMIEAHAIDFWERHVEADIPPDAKPTLEITQRMRRTAGRVTTVPVELLSAFQVANAARKAAEEIENDAKAALLAAMGDADGAEAPGWSATYREVRQQRIDADALRTGYPEIAKAVTKASSYRRLNVKECK